MVFRKRDKTTRNKRVMYGRKKKRWGYNSGYGRLPDNNTVISYLSLLLIAFSLVITFYYTKIREEDLSTSIMGDRRVIVGTPSGFSSPVRPIEVIE